MAGIYGGIMVVTGLLGDPWLGRSNLLAVVLVAAILGLIGFLMWQSERVDRISRDDFEVRQLEKWYGDKQPRTLKDRFAAWLDGLE
jgi:predicted negative regulator of RcsB-dependent stress response